MTVQRHIPRSTPEPERGDRGRRSKFDTPKSRALKENFMAAAEAAENERGGRR